MTEILSGIIIGTLRLFGTFNFSIYQQANIYDVNRYGVTLFSMPKDDTIGILAHNTGAGLYFHYLSEGDLVEIEKDGELVSYEVSHIRKYRALSPNSPTSDFEDLETGEELSVEELYQFVYEDWRGLVLQTCIEEFGLSTWGRLFVFCKEVQHDIPEAEEWQASYKSKGTQMFR